MKGEYHVANNRKIQKRRYRRQRIDGARIAGPATAQVRENELPLPRRPAAPDVGVVVQRKGENKNDYPARSGFVAGSPRTGSLPAGRGGPGKQGDERNRKTVPTNT